LKKSFFSFTPDQLGNLSFIDKPFRVKQLIELVINNKIFNFSMMTNLPKDMRADLEQAIEILDIKSADNCKSKDGTIKFLFETSDGFYIESVYLKDKNNRVTFCISTQSGCRMGCAFCKTGKMGLLKNLSSSEILSQILYLSKIMSEDVSVDDKAYNIVFMGMGEPLDNFDNLVPAIKILNSKLYFNIPLSRITVSTCGIVDKIFLLLKEFRNIRLAVSLITANQGKREKIIPIAKKYPVKDIYEGLTECYRLYKNRITLEYVLIKDFNMSDNDIEDLMMFRTEYFHINLIPLNNNDVDRPKEEEIKTFFNKLSNLGFIVTRRYRRGEDIQADCGQLFWDYNNKSV
jgi:23S rRNA (adenine2503-C2)-methyltransferase